ncbi:MAG: hypothetical protein QW620_07350 [Thermoplasmata archaeon]
MAAGKTVKKIEKTMEAETASLLKDIILMEMRKLAETTGVEIMLFVGVDGRNFSSIIPPSLTPLQFHMFNLLKQNIPSICSQLKNENLIESIQIYENGTIYITGVGRNLFLASVKTGSVNFNESVEISKKLASGAIVLEYLTSQKPTDEKSLEKLPEDVRAEIKQLTRQLFVERFEQTRQYKKNMEILAYIKEKLATVVGVGAVNEIVELTFNEMGTSAPYMNDTLWLAFVERLIKEHVKRLSGEIVAEECYKTWVPEIEKKLKMFV